MKGADGQSGEDAEDQAQEGLECRSFCLPQEVGPPDVDVFSQTWKLLKFLHFEVFMETSSHRCDGSLTPSSPLLRFQEDGAGVGVAISIF